MEKYQNNVCVVSEEPGRSTAEMAGGVEIGSDAASRSPLSRLVVMALAMTCGVAYR